MATAHTPAFVRNINDEDNRIIRVAETPADYISIHGVEYLEERAEDADDNEWSTLQEKFLEKDTETTFRWTGFSSVSCQGDTNSFPDAVAYRIEGDETEYTKAEILDLINSWEPSFSGYTYWDGHNWSFQHTADELGEWEAVEVEETELARRQGRGHAYTLYLLTAAGDTDYYEGVSGPGGEQLWLVDLEMMDSDADWADEVRELLYEAINTHLAAERAGAGVEEAGQARNLFAERRTLAELIEMLVATGEETSEADLRTAFAEQSTLL